MHDRAGIIASTQVINLVEIILEKVILHATLDVVPVDGDVFISVSSALLVPEARGMHQLVHHDPSVDTTIAKTHLLSPASPANTGAAATALHDVNVSSLIGSWNKAKTSLFVIVGHGLGNDSSFSAVESARDDVGNDTTWPLPPAVSDSIPARLALN